MTKEANSDNQEGKPEKKAKGAPKKDAESGSVTHESRKVEEKPNWTIQRAKRCARRFNSVEEWSKGHPSSYKAATAHGWLRDCSAHMKSKVADINANRPKYPKMPASA